MVTSNLKGSEDIKLYQLPRKEHAQKSILNALMTTIPKKVIIFLHLSQIYLFIHAYIPHTVLGTFPYKSPFSQKTSGDRPRDTDVYITKTF